VVNTRKKYVVAVSGGIDSVVLLDMLVRDKTHNLVVAHFDHGIRDDSADDARFVEGLARRYGLPFYTKREELGAGASESDARARRYAFLSDIAREHEGTIATAHHADDIIETVAINLVRGTGWRGLAVLNRTDIERPLLHLTKHEIRMYALANRLEWVEDSTNQTQAYLRNRIRLRIARHLNDAKRHVVLELWKRQRELKREIAAALDVYVKSDRTYDRYFFIQVDSRMATEVLRHVVQYHSGLTPTRPQAERALIAIKTAKPAASFQIGSAVSLRFTERSFIVETP
jgi:tRNA(Ile)-lysidine synthase